MNPRTTATAAISIKICDIKTVHSPAASRPPLNRCTRELFDLAMSKLARFRICREHFRYRLQNVCRRFRKHVFYDLGDFVKANLAVQERSHRNLVGSVECNWFRTSCLSSGISQAQIGEFFHVRGTE